MATQSVCKIEGCDKVTVGRGLCSMHYARWRRHGDPVAGRSFYGSAEAYLRDVVHTYEGDECLIWPLQRDHNGYARIDRDGRNQIVSRVICQEVNGAPPTPKHEAAHACGKGHEGCVTKRHVRWATHAENMRDKFRHGTTMRGQLAYGAKLTEDDVREIRQAAHHESHQAIADRYGVSRSNIGALLNRKSWYWLE